MDCVDLRDSSDQYGNLEKVIRLFDILHCFCLKQDSIHLRLMIKLEDILLRSSLHIGHEDINESRSFEQVWILQLCGQ